MRAFTFERAHTPAEAATAAARHPGAKFVAGGTNLLDLMKLEIETPTHLIDVNGLGQSQPTMDRFDVDKFAGKFRAFGWFAVTVDGHNYDEIVAAFEKCRREAGDLPRAIVAKTHKGKGVSLFENKEGWHGKPVPKQDLEKVLAELSQPFASDGFRPRLPERTAAPPEEAPIEITRSGDIVEAKLGASGEMAHMKLKREAGADGKGVVLRNVGYFGAQRNNGFELYKSIDHSANVNGHKFNYADRNAFLISIDREDAAAPKP